MDYNEKLLQDAIKDAEARGKEPFDFVKFAEYYWHDTGGCERLRPDEPAPVQNHYRRMYYTYYPEVMTVTDYAALLNEIDMES